MFQGRAFELKALKGGIRHLVFDLKNESTNKFNLLAMSELEQVLDVLKSDQKAKGLLVSSAKDAFVVGADINEFGSVFAKGPDSVDEHLKKNNRSFNRLEDLPFPTLVLVSGYALGGGLEFCLACDYRVATSDAQLGLPETKLGIIPGWGGTVRLPRLAGVDVAVEWIASGKNNKASKAFTDGVIDAVLEAKKPEQALDLALSLLERLMEGSLDWSARREQKKSPLRHPDMESILAFESSKAYIKAQAGRHYPAPVTAISAMQSAAKFNRDDALNIERDSFCKLTQTDTCQSLVGLFLADQALVKKAKLLACQSASKGVPALMKDITTEGLSLGMNEASKLFAKQVERGRLSHLEMAQALSNITPTLSFEGFGGVELVVEAVVENHKLKKAVLAETERHISADSVLCSNTSTISIDLLAQGLERPDKFCGMHFFNPVHRMPLVEVIRGSKSSEESVAQVVSYAQKLGKKVVVVNDCPGFLVNRVLFPYLAGFSMLLRDGADFQKLDQVMERWGWPMGPAQLLDVVGIDTASHAEGVMAKAYPSRMTKEYESAVDKLYAAEHYGQKTGVGFYAYEQDQKGKQLKVNHSETYELIKNPNSQLKEFDDEQIIARMMLPMATEMLLCLEEGIVTSAQEADMALIYGLGFPPFRGGLFRWIDQLGGQNFLTMLDKYQDLGPLYSLSPTTREHLQSGATYYSSKA